ncbi:uncharacterized protein HaLaN_06628 [Haematococcus lacustris]|uniref:40S ribosomal protein S18 n=1 Tax=Haematococcus lacustris TaxID=44745 RepID=A0A699Z6R4_HAELA|nr:uncharacterized protein HaLaN_06628 [Haematococcus lacustris]
MKKSKRMSEEASRSGAVVPCCCLFPRACISGKLAEGASRRMGSLIAGQEFQHILRLLNTNVDGRVKIMYALTAIKGIGRRFSNIVCKKAEVDMKKRAGECSAEELERLMTIVANPANYKIPTWFLNRQKDYKTGRFTQAAPSRRHSPSNFLSSSVQLTAGGGRHAGIVGQCLSCHSTALMLAPIRQPCPLPGSQPQPARVWSKQCTHRTLAISMVALVLAEL